MRLSRVRHSRLWPGIIHQCEYRSGNLQACSTTHLVGIRSSSYYKKSGLAPAHHRVRMCELAVEHTSTWLMVDPWEAGQPEYQRTAVVLDHFDEMLNGKDGEGGVEMRDGSRRKYKVMLLAGGDLIESFGEPGVWSEPDVSRRPAPEHTNDS